MKLKEISVTWKFTWKTKPFIKNINIIPFHLLKQYELFLKKLVPLKFYLCNYSLCSKNLSTILSSLCSCVGRQAFMWRSEDNFYGFVGSGTKLRPPGFPVFNQWAIPFFFFQILSLFFFKMFVVGMYLFVQVKMGMYSHVYVWSGQRPPFHLILWDSLSLNPGLID